jgi:hypothetical protein
MESGYQRGGGGPPGDDLERIIEDAWAEAGPGPGAQPVEAVRARIRIQRLAFGCSWMMMLPVFIWLMWPWVDGLLGAPGAAGGRARGGAGRRLAEVRARLKALADSTSGTAEEQEEERAGLRARERRLERLVRAEERAGGAAGPRVVIGAVGLAIWIVMISLMLRGGTLAAPGGSGEPGLGRGIRR